jgi:hypothetical protein
MASTDFVRGRVNTVFDSIQKELAERSEANPERQRGM